MVIYKIIYKNHCQSKPFFPYSGTLGVLSLNNNDFLSSCPTIVENGIASCHLSRCILLKRPLRGLNDLRMKSLHDWRPGPFQEEVPLELDRENLLTSIPSLSQGMDCGTSPFQNAGTSVWFDEPPRHPRLVGRSLCASGWEMQQLQLEPELEPEPEPVLLVDALVDASFGWAAPKGEDGLELRVELQAELQVAAPVGLVDPADPRHCCSARYTALDELREPVDLAEVVDSWREQKVDRTAKGLRDIKNTGE